MAIDTKVLINFVVVFSCDTIASFVQKEDFLSDTVATLLKMDDFGAKNRKIANLIRVKAIQSL